MEERSEVWPSADLEYLGQCPVCGSKEREPLHGPLTDRLFQCAPGEWQLHTCQQCELGYLDPRPSMQSIGRAYATYFTHGNSAHSENSGRFRALRARMQQVMRGVLNDFRNKRWGMRLKPVAFGGRFLVSALLPLRSLVLAHMRHLPPRPPYLGAKLLDVGCGDGAFLEIARAAGWQVTGIDFDPKAVEVARGRGIHVISGDLGALKDQVGCYEYISCSHVIEHVHSPAQWLSQMHALLAPRGTLWLQTPNLDSIGHYYFGHHWRDLDPPRHLCLFAPKSFQLLMESSGFQCEFRKLPFFMAISIYLDSTKLARGKYSQRLDLWIMFIIPIIIVMGILQTLFRRRSEFITVIARCGEQPAKGN